MRKIRKQKIRVIRQADPAKFEAEFNQLTDDLSDLNPETTIDINNDCFTAVFQYVIETLIPETATEELEAKGLHYSCMNCPRFEPALNNDGSVKQTAKKGKCFLQEYTCRDSRACEWFCKGVLSGEITPKEGV